MNGERQRVVCTPATDTVVVRLGTTPIELAPNVDAVLDRILGALEAR